MRCCIFGKDTKRLYSLGRSRLPVVVSQPDQRLVEQKKRSLFRIGEVRQTQFSFQFIRFTVTYFSDVYAKVKKKHTERGDTKDESFMDRS